MSVLRAVVLLGVELAKLFDILENPAKLLGEAVDLCGGEVQLREPSVEYVESYDAATGLLVDRIEQVPGPAGDVQLDGEVTGWIETGGLKVPSGWAHSTPQQEWAATFEKVELGVSRPKDFGVPESLSREDTPPNGSERSNR